MGARLVDVIEDIHVLLERVLTVVAREGDDRPNQREWRRFVRAAGARLVEVALGAVVPVPVRKPDRHLRVQHVSAHEAERRGPERCAQDRRPLHKRQQVHRATALLSSPRRDGGVLRRMTLRETV